PRPATRKREFNIELAAAGDGAIHAIVDLGRPAPDVIVLPVNAEGKSRDLNRVFRDGWLSFLALRRRRVHPEEKQEHKDKFDHRSSPRSRPPPDPCRGKRSTGQARPARRSSRHRTRPLRATRWPVRPESWPAPGFARASRAATSRRDC